MKYKGIIISESLNDPDFLKKSGISPEKITHEGEWHLNFITITTSQINEISKELKSGSWYAHFWSGDDVVVVFKDKMFKQKHSNKTTWKKAIRYGKSIGIPESQLDFPIEVDD